VTEVTVPRADSQPTPAAWSSGRAVAALTFGAVGLFLFNIVFGPLAIALGTVAVRRNESGRLGRIAAVAGIVLGVADLLVLAGLIASRVHGGTLDWRLGR
jgi:hypothetical protein